MREEESRWEEELPAPEDLMPLSQTLITPDLALAFDIPNHHHHQAPLHHHHHHHHYQHQHHYQQQLHGSPPGVGAAAVGVGGGGGGGGGPQPSASATPPPQGTSCSATAAASASAADYDTVGGSGDEPARTLKRPRLVWTPQLHKRFVDAVAHLGIKNAVPKTIMQLMSVDGLTRENVASHLQKYRLYLKRMQGIHSSNGSNGGGGGSSSNGGLSDSATDRLFATSPVPAHFLRPNSDHFIPSYVPVPMVGHGHGHAHAHAHPQLQQQQFRGHFGNSPPNGGASNAQFEQQQQQQQQQHPFLPRQSQRMGATLHGTSSNSLVASSPSYVEDMESAAATPNGRKVLTLFPTADD